MNQYEQRSKNSYNKKAKKYDSSFDGKFTNKFKDVLYDAVRINANDIVADVACGNGRFLKRIAENNCFYGYGVDISEEMVEQARILNPGMHFFVAGCDNLPFANTEIDVMTVCAAYHHFPEVHKFAQEANRVLKQGGMLYIAEIYLPAFLRIMLNPFVKFSKAGDVKFYGANEISLLFENNGFIVKDILVKGKVQLIILQKV